MAATEVAAEAVMAAVAAEDTAVAEEVADSEVKTYSSNEDAHCSF